MKNGPERAPRCAVIVAAHNAAAHIDATILSVTEQTLAEWELIAVDDGSTDDTYARLRAWEDPRIRVAAQANGGPSSARNHGLRLATAPLVLVLDADDQLRQDALARLIAPLEADPRLVAAYGEAATVDAAGRQIGAGGAPFFAQRTGGDVAAALARGNFIATGGVICLRRAAVEAAGGYREDLSVAEDVEFWCRVALQGPFAHVPGPPVLDYRIHPDSVVRTRGRDPSDALRCVAAIFENPAMIARLGADAARARRAAEGAIFSFTANDRLRAGEWAAARALLGESLRRNPWRPREWVLWALANLHWLPGPARRRLK